MPFRHWFVLAAMVGSCAHAQSISSSITGRVADSQRLGVEGARVTVSSPATGIELTATSGEGGSFRFPSVPPGHYDVAVTAPGFAPQRFEHVSLTVGQTRFLDAVMQPESVSQSVTVDGNQALREQPEAAAVATFDTRLMNDLPSLAGTQGRNFRGQVQLTPSVAPSTNAHRPFATAGARTRNNSYQIDSSDYNEIEGGLLMGRGASEQLLSLEAVQGMQVQTHNYKAEYGRNNGAIISLVTKSGTNEWHGSVYEFLRNEAFSARNTFDLQRPPLKTHQNGVTIGGPIRKDRTFVFGNFESYLRSFTSSTTIQTLTPAQRAQAAPVVRPLVNLYPEPNLPGTNLYRANVPQSASLYTFLVRADHAFSDTSRLFGRSLYLTTGTETRAGASLVAANRDIGTQSHSLHHSWAASPRVLNEARMQFTRFHINDQYVDPVELGDSRIHGAVGAVTVSGLSGLGHYSFMAQRNFQNSFQWSDDLSIVRGRHTFKAGSALRRQQLNGGRYNNALVGQLRFLNVADFLAGRPASFTRNVGQVAVGLRSTEWNTYAQDDWQLHPRLTLHLGLRYELNTVPREVDGLIAERFRYAGDRNNFAPRVSFTLRADRDGRTVVRGGYGIYYNVLELSFIGLTRFNPPLIANQTAANPALPIDTGVLRSGIPGGLVIPDRNLRTPYSQHVNLHIERQVLGPRAQVSLGYLGTGAVKLPRNALPNGGDALAQTLRPDPSVGVINQLRTDTNSRYHALQAGFDWRAASDLTVRTSYTFSKSLDVVSDFPSGNTGIERGILPIDESNLRLNRGPSDFDIRHLFNVLYTYDLPWLKRNRFLGGWQLLGVTQVVGGRPYSLFSGSDTPIGSSSNRILNLPGAIVRYGAAGRTALALGPGASVASLTPARGTIGTIGRNTERSDNQINWNVTLGKTFALSERWRAQFRVETFNLFNQTNYDLPDGVLNSRTFGQALTAFDARQIQFGLKITF